MKPKTLFPGFRRLLLFGALLGLLAGGANTAHAAGLLIADGGFGGVLQIKGHDVQVTVNNGIAVTEVTQVFHNTEKRQVEALYTFPAPRGASVANFSMWINGKEMVGEVLEKKRAREIYESYKQTRRDPGLLEQVDYRAFEMRIFPIAPGSDQKVRLTYYQELDYDHDWATYVYPLATTTRAVSEAKTTGKFAISVVVKSPMPIAALESPSHGEAFAVAKHNESFWQANLETTGGSLTRDVVIAHRIARPKTGLDLVTSKRPGQDGFFCLMLRTGEELGQNQDSMDYVFVLDASGSMADQGKLLISKDSVAAFLNELGDADRFEVMVFNMQPDLAFNQLRSATPENRTAALAYLARQQARGGTILQPAIATAYKYAAADRPLNVVILSDGLTEQQERRILLEQIQKRPGNTRVFCIGVGNDVNRPLLEQLAEDSGGLAAFISPGDNFTRQARAFRQKLQRPFATNLDIRFDGMDVTDLEPKILPNLYSGAPVRLYGRYRGSGNADVTVRGSVNGKEFKQTAKLEFPKTDADNPEIDRLWAWHRINRLMKEADRQGDRSPVVDEIVRLGEDFSIASEYTSFIVLENNSEFQRWKIARKNLETFGRDQAVQARRREQLDSIRSKALADLGPQPVAGKPAPTPQQFASNTKSVPQSSPAPATQASDTTAPARRQSWNFSTGTSPVGPFGVLAVWWLLRRKQRMS